MTQSVEIHVLENSLEYDIINKVEDDKLSDLFNDLSMIQFDYGGAPRTPTGLALKLNYDDGYEVICDTCILWANSDNEWIEQKDISFSIEEYDKFNELILKFKTEG